MRKKILAMSVPILAIMALTVVPTVAQAADEIQGSEFTASSFISKIEIPKKEVTVECAEAVLQFSKITASQATLIGGAFRTSTVEPHCKTSKATTTAIIQTNAATVGWFFHTGEKGVGSLQGGLGKISLTVHLYTFPAQELIESCTLVAEENIVVEYEQKVNNPVLTVTGNLESGACEKSTLKGTFVTAGGLFIH